MGFVVFAANLRIAEASGAVVKIVAGEAFMSNTLNRGRGTAVALHIVMFHRLTERHESFRHRSKCALVPGILDREEVVFRRVACACCRRRQACLAEVHVGTFDALVAHAADGLSAMVTNDIWMFNLLGHGLRKMGRPGVSVITTYMQDVATHRRGGGLLLSLTVGR